MVGEEYAAGRMTFITDEEMSAFTKKAAEELGIHIMPAKEKS